MAYTIIKSDGTVLTTIADGTLNTTSTSVSLPGRDYSGYGRFLDSNFVWMLENFANNAPPSNPLRGQLWFNTNDNTLYVCPADGTTNPANWIKLAASEGNTNVTYGNITATGNILGNNINSVNVLSGNILQITANANVGNISATTGVFTNVSGNGAQLTNITGANVVGTVANATYATTAGTATTADTATSATTAGTVTTASQPNITSTGTLTSLSVSGTANLGASITMSASGGAIVTGPGLAGSGSGGVLRTIAASNTAYIQAGTYNTGNSAAPLAFTTINNITEWMRLDTSGNLGINTDAPISKLHVNGNALVGISGSANNNSIITAGVFRTISGTGILPNTSPGLTLFTVYGSEVPYSKWQITIMKTLFDGLAPDPFYNLSATFHLTTNGGGYGILPIGNTGNVVYSILGGGTDVTFRVYNDIIGMDAGSYEIAWSAMRLI